MTQTYYKYKVTNVIHIQDIITLHDFRLDKDFHSFEEAHVFHEFVYCRKGSLYVVHDGENTLLKEGEIILHSPNTVHSLYADGVVAPSIFIVSFVCKSKRIAHLENHPIEVPSRLKPILKMIFDVGSETFDIDNTTPDTKKMDMKEDAAFGGLQSLTNLLEFFLIELLRSAEAEKINFLVNTNELVGKIIAYLENNLSSKLSIEELTDHFGYSKSLLFKQFKAATGTSIMSYFTELKIKKAKQYLRYSDLTLSEIATELGFADSNYFIRVFKTVTGTTPKRYRMSKKASGNAIPSGK